MTALISAELLRLRTVRAPRLVFLGVLVLVAINAVPVGGAPPGSATDIADVVRGATVLALFQVAFYAAYNVGDAFKRGAMAMTFVAHPQRARVIAAHAITYAAVSLVVAAVTTGVAIALALAIADGHDVATDFSASDVARAIAGTAFGGAVFGAAGVLVGTIFRHPAAGMAIAVLSVAESIVTRGGTRGGIGPYLPLRVVGGVTGTSDVAAWAAMALLVAYLALLAAGVHRWALARDLT